MLPTRLLRTFIKKPPHCSVTTRLRFSVESAAEPPSPSTSLVGKDEEERRRKEKLLALFGERKVAKPTQSKVTKVDTEKGEQEAAAFVVAEKAWETSQYVDYMSNQREKGWKT